MPINKARNENGEYFGYFPMEQREMYAQYKEIIEVFSNYIDINGVDSDKCSVDTIALLDILGKIDRRREYFKIFHENVLLSEIREVALLSYWILKLKPFRWQIPNADLIKRSKIRDVNEGMAIYIILSTLKACAKAKGLGYGISVSFKEKLTYAVRNWDLSKEAIMLVVETLYEKLKIE